MTANMLVYENATRDLLSVERSDESLCATDAVGADGGETSDGAWFHDPPVACAEPGADRAARGGSETVRAQGALTRAALVKMLTEKFPGLTREEGKRLVDGLFELMAETLISGENLHLDNFGAFTVRSKATRPGRNVRTGEYVAVSARRSISFKPSGKMKEAVNGGSALPRSDKKSHTVDAKGRKLRRRKSMTREQE